MSQNDGNRSTPFVHSEARFRTTFGTLVVIIVVVGGSVAAWMDAMADIRDHEKVNLVQDKRIDTVEAVQRQQTELLWEIRGDVKALRSERRTP